MKEIEGGEGLLRFRIPHDWKSERDEDGEWMHFADVPNSGTLRVSVITATSPTPFPPGTTGMIMLSNKAQETAERWPDGTAFSTFSKASIEDGRPLMIRFWEVGKLLPPKLGRNAVFSYAVAAGLERVEPERGRLEMLDVEIRRARFALLHE